MFTLFKFISTFPYNWDTIASIGIATVLPKGKVRHDLIAASLLRP